MLKNMRINYLLGAYSMLLSFVLDYVLIRALYSGLFDDVAGVRCCGFIACAVAFTYFVGVNYIFSGIKNERHY